MASSLPSDLLHRSPEEAVRRIALSFLDEAYEGSGRLDDPDDAEALHDFRVGIRRLRSTLRAWKKLLKGSVGRKQRLALKAVQNATGGGRDAEVAIEWLESERPGLSSGHRLGLQWLVERLGRRHAAAMEHACDGLRGDFQGLGADLRERLGRMRVEVVLGAGTDAPTFATALAANARTHLRDLLDQIDRVQALDDRDDAHEARIRTKRLRYLFEPVQPHVPEAVAIVKRCKKLQDVLGDLNDAHVLRDDMGQALEDAAVEQARKLHELTDDADDEALRREVRRSARPGLLEVARRVRARSRDLFDRFVREWLEDRAAGLQMKVDAAILRLERMGSAGVETERKYLLSGRPDLPDDAEVGEIEQGWLPGDKLRERLRRHTVGRKTRYFRTVKMGKGIRRVELEEQTSKTVFDALWALTEGCRVRKKRYRVPDGAFVWEVDEFTDRDLYLAEVELPDAETEVPPPAWLAPYVVRDVTGESEYVNLNLAR